MVVPRAQVEAQTQVSRRAFVAIATFMAASPAYANTLDPAFVDETRILSATINDYMTLVCHCSEAALIPPTSIPNNFSLAYVERFSDT